MKELKLNRPLIIFDLETTGNDTVKDRIVELTACKIYPTGNKDIKTMRFNPEIPISKEAEDVHHISNEDVKNLTTFRSHSKSIYEFFKDCDLGGYNIIKFDLPLLTEEFNRCNIKDFPSSDVKFVDAFKIFGKMEKRDLSSAYKYYCNKEHNTAHSSEGDVSVTTEIIYAQIEKYDFEPNIEVLNELSVGDTIDFAGRLKRDKNGVIVFAFGKNEGRSVLSEPNYCAWILSSDFTLDTKNKIKLILEKKLS